ncbi:hypothetical protein EJ04DRAFT_542036 [Polyplosphaeria fusca]|uniref:Mediator of RNA polymerase II transcription subunit 18 n=1 Tax=Polyplosphaeria fusca TaxID=682080 RepID=A0A9P4V2G3_9PLEO|nr:hypothetical protein EJ04DRAFT_542036 [Polyplosphaeria fusca]
MHELLLYGQVPQSRHDQVLKVLAGVAAMQPRRVLQRHLVYRPLRDPDEPGNQLKRGGKQEVSVKQAKHAAPKDLYYSQLVAELAEEHFVNLPADSLIATSHREDPKWTFEFRDVPDTGDRGVLVRLAISNDMSTENVHDFMVNSGYRFVSEYYQEGHRFVHENVVILLHRVLCEPHVPSPEPSPKVTMPTFNALQPREPSGAYILETKIRVQDLNNPNVLDAGVDELKRFKTQMKGCVELSCPDRLQLDTRVKYKAPVATHPTGRPGQPVVR